MTPSTCSGFCKNFTYFGVEAGNQCYCGHTIQNGYPKVEDRDCAQVCNGSANRTLICGGPWRLDLYTSTARAIGPPAVNYTDQGCFVDQETRGLTGGNYSIDNMTPQLCAGLCGDYRFAGVENGNQCFCGNTWPSTYLKADQKECNDTCGGDPALTCGATWRLELYAIG